MNAVAEKLETTLTEQIADISEQLAFLIQRHNEAETTASIHQQHNCRDRLCRQR